MAKIDGIGASGAGPLYDLERAEGPEQMDVMALAASVADLDLVQVETFERLLGLGEIPPQPGHLDPPPAGGPSLASISGPQARGLLRHASESCRLQADQVRSLLGQQPDRPEVQGLQTRLGYIGGMLQKVDEIIRGQDDILTKVVTEQKS